CRAPARPRALLRPPAAASRPAAPPPLRPSWRAAPAAAGPRRAHAALCRAHRAASRPRPRRRPAPGSRRSLPRS
ncbi:translation initiation factor IF-2-like, partial [Octopus sinensis]|uniref:Translation initiation factor IF-2-like n=1 Tax=Octopus sinensis TaxID=2607531 RepID=A0A7E6EL00_9MOLL